MDFDWDWRLFLDYLDVLAWPLVVLVVIIIFRGRLHELMTRVTHAEGPGFKAEFAEFVAKGAEFVRKETSETARSDGNSAGSHHDLRFEDDAGMSDKVEVGVPTQHSNALDASGSTSTEGTPMRLPSINMKVTEFADLIDGYGALEAYDEVVMDISAMKHEIAKSGAGMWALGLQMGTMFTKGREYVAAEESGDDDRIVLRRSQTRT